MASSAAGARQASSAGACGVSLTRCAGAEGGGGLVRCALRGRLPKAESGRRKVLAVILDRSGSMAGATWRRVVSAVADVVTDELLEDPCVSLVFVAFSDQAVEVPPPRRAAELRELLLSREYSPQGGTSFKAAFALAQAAVLRELSKHAGQGRPARDVDLAALVFTDGEDTSVKGARGRHGVRLVDQVASRAAARAAGDAFREALRGTGCATHLCVAAFGEDHDPGQCQYLSDRYFYINRGEALADVLAGGLGALLSSAGQCGLRLQLPPGVALEEPIPASLPLDSQGRLDHHVWLRVEADAIDAEERLSVDVDVAGAPVLRGSAAVRQAADVDADSFEGHAFVLDLVALQLRQIARGLCGRRPGACELGKLRERLTEAKGRVQPTRAAAHSARGHLRGRAALRERLAEVDSARERLSYALGQFDEHDVNDSRQIGSVAIDAILRDAGQHVPQGPAAAGLARRAAALAALPAPEALSKHGVEYTTDGYSCCDARELASQGDALFFQLGSARPLPGGVGFAAAEDCCGMISFEAFQLLSRDGRQPVKSAERDEGFTHLGVPLYATEGHFARARLLLPDALRLLSPGGSYQPGASELQLLGLLGRSLAAGPAKTEAQTVALLHKARAVRAVLASTPSATPGESLLDAAVAGAARFRAEPSARAGCGDLYATAAAGLLAQAWGEEEVAGLASAVVEEALRRRVAHALRGAGEAQRLCLVWALLGPCDEDGLWLDRELPCPDAGELLLSGSGFCPFRAPEELESLEAAWPGRAAPRPAGAAALLSVLSGKRGASDNGPQPGEWATLRAQLLAWGRAVGEIGGTGELWATLDALMTDDDPRHLEAVRGTVATLRSVPSRPCLRAAFPDASAVTSVAAAVCLGTSAVDSQGLRPTVAAALRSLVEKRRALVCKYPITGSSFPKLDDHSRETVNEVWGASAYPVDPELHHKAMLRVWRRTMKARITSTLKEALADKEYRRRGGRFVFPSPLDTFVRGLHRRTADLHADWTRRLGRDASGPAARAEAVEEMLLRLRWDDADAGARARLSEIVGRIWDGLQGVDLAEAAPIPSALWLGAGGGTARREPPGPPAPRLAAGPGAAAAPEGKAGEAAAAPGRRAEEARGPPQEPAGHPRGAEAARAAMDPGLQAALDGLEHGLRERLRAFAERASPGQRVKLPLELRAVQRKAVHLWAEAHGLGHRSFGYRGRRRLHLTAPGPAEAGGDSGAAGAAAEEFDWDAWQEDASASGQSDEDGAR